MMRSLILTTFAHIVLAIAVHAQVTDTAIVSSDTARIVQGSDTTVVFQVKNALDTLVNYVAKDSVVYRLKDKKATLFGTANIDYGTLGVKAERITIDWNASMLVARGVPDTSAEREGKLMGTPVFKEGSEKYEGKEMTYNFKTKRGMIVEGETEIDDGFYLGEKIKRMSDDVYFIGHGRYTTCDNPDHKHYYFGSPQMKVIPNDVVIAEPIYFFIEDIPLFALPFAVIPSKGGRTSGIIPPTFGDDARRGRNLRGFGYYLAASDYWDLKLTADWYSKGGYQANAAVQYSLRYNFSGSITASYGRQQFDIGSVFRPDDPTREDFKIGIRHSQTLDPLSRLSADFTFMTDSYVDNFSTNIDQLLTQNSYSSAGYNTSWEGTNRSLSVNISRNQDLRNGTSITTLPDVSFNQSQIYPFRGDDFFGEGAWYEMIGFNYSSRLLSTLDLRKRTERDASGQQVDVKELFDRRGIQHNIGLITSPKFGYITIQPSFNFTERWYDHRLERYYDESDSTVKARDAYGFYALHTFSFGVSANTKLYGTLTPNVFGILGIRHTLQPSLSYSYNPDFSKESWGYYLTYRDRTNEVRYDPYTGYAYRPGTVFGGVPSGESQTLGMNLSNIFEMKLSPSEEDTTMTPRKFQLFNLNASSSYNFVRDSLKLAPVSLSFRTSIENLLDIYGGATLTPYVFQLARVGIDTSGNPYVIESGRELNRYLFSEGRGLARLTNFDIHFSTNIRSEMFESKSKDTSNVADAGGYSFRIPWDLSLGFDYSMNQSNPSEKARSSSMRASLNIKPTPNWRISASTYYDFVTKEIGTPQINISRDLHCWEMNFSWVPTGAWRSYSLVIRLKAPQLQDIKIEKKGSDRGVYY